MPAPQRRRPWGIASAPRHGALEIAWVNSQFLFGKEHATIMSGLNMTELCHMTKHWLSLFSRQQPDRRMGR
jgi:hypothetical protein